MNTTFLSVLLTFHLGEGDFDRARKTADLFPDPLRSEEITKNLSHFVEKGKFVLAERAAKMLGRILTPKELEQIIEAGITSPMIADGYDNAASAAALLPEPQRTQRLIEILEGFVCRSRRRDSTELAKEIAQLLSEPWKSQYLEIL